MMQVRKMFDKINISTFQLVVDPIFTMFCCCSSCNLCGCSRQRRTLEQVDEKFSQEMEVTMLLKKVRDSYDLLKNAQKKQYRKYLKYNKKRVIELKESSTSSDD